MERIPAAVRAAIDAAAGPALVFDLARIERNLRALAAAARAAGGGAVTVLFACKSFAHPAVWELAAGAVDGFDVASAAELAAVGALRPRVVSIADPTGAAAAAAAAVAMGSGARVIVSCETPAQVAAAPAGAEIAIRLSASAGGRDPAIGAAQDGGGFRRSRFGVDVEPARRRAQIAAMRAAAHGPVGLHVHLGPVTAASASRLASAARRALDDADFAPAFVNLGGSWHGLADLPAALRELRAAVPAACELILEPGRLVSDGAGFATGRVALARELDDRPLRVLDLSRACHLRWSHPALVGEPPAPGTARPILWVGPTCYEEDVVGEWAADPACYGAGARVALAQISGYAVGWNTGFGGVPPAAVVIA